MLYCMTGNWLSSEPNVALNFCSITTIEGCRHQRIVNAKRHVLSYPKCTAAFQTTAAAPSWPSRPRTPGGVCKETAQQKQITCLHWDGCGIEMHLNVQYRMLADVSSTDTQRAGRNAILWHIPDQMPQTSPVCVWPSDPASSRSEQLRVHCPLCNLLCSALAPTGN